MVHVAGRRLKHKIPDEIKAMLPTDVTADDWVDRYMAYTKAEKDWRRQFPGEEYPTVKFVDGETVPGEPGWTLADSEYEELSGPHAGETYSEGSPGDCADRLEEIRSSGLNVPQYAIDALREEQTCLTRE